MNTFANRSVAVALILAGVAAPAAVADGQAKPAAVAAGTRQVSGRVLGPDGKPVAGAKLFTYVLKRPLATPADVESTFLGTTDAEGRFTVSVSPISKNARISVVMASAAGFGVDWLLIDDASSPESLRDQALRLTEDVPITGRIVNAENRPVAGVSVSIAAIHVPVGHKLDSYLSEWKSERASAFILPEKFFPGPSDRIFGSTTTDQDGRFTLRGAGAERGVDVQISGAGIARSKPHVITRRGFDPKPYNSQPANEATSRPQSALRVQRLYGPEFTFDAQAGKEMTGVVTDAVTGAPIPGCRVSELGGEGFAGADRTDAQGRYRLDGLAKNAKGYKLSVMPPEGTAYLERRPRTDDSDGYAPVRFDVRLGKGGVVTGRVVDKQTGKGVQSFLKVAPLAGNKFFETKPEYGPDAAENGFAITDADGRFRLVTLPGSELILARAMGEKLQGNYVHRYRPAVRDPEHNELFLPSFDGTWAVSTAGNGKQNLIFYSAVKVIDVKETGETAVELSVDPGKTATVAVQDAAGRPLAGAWISGASEVPQSAYRLTEATVTIYALDPEQPRTLVICHPDKKLGGTVTVRGDEKQPAVVKLDATARIIGRLIDSDGKPLQGVEPLLYSPEKNIQQMYSAICLHDTVASDKDGRFVVENVLPGTPVRLVFRKGKQGYADDLPSEPYTINPGATVDLVDVTLKPLR